MPYGPDALLGQLYTYRKICENKRKTWKMKSVWRGISRHFFCFSHFAVFRAWVGIHTKSKRISWFIFSQH